MEEMLCLCARQEQSLNQKLIAQRYSAQSKKKDHRPRFPLFLPFRFCEFWFKWSFSRKAIIWRNLFEAFTSGLAKWEKRRQWLAGAAFEGWRVTLSQTLIFKWFPLERRYTYSGQDLLHGKQNGIEENYGISTMAFSPPRNHSFNFSLQIEQIRFVIFLHERKITVNQSTIPWTNKLPWPGKHHRNSSAQQNCAWKIIKRTLEMPDDDQIMKFMTMRKLADNSLWEYKAFER